MLGPNVIVPESRDILSVLNITDAFKRFDRAEMEHVGWRDSSISELFQFGAELLASEADIGPTRMDVQRVNPISSSALRLEKHRLVLDAVACPIDADPSTILPRPERAHVAVVEEVLKSFLA